MGITSFWFLLFATAVWCLYYLTPGAVQWVVLLVASVVFYLLAGHPLLIAYPLFASLIAYAAALIISKKNPEKETAARRGVLAISILLLLAVLVAVKYVRLSGVMTILVPAGLSFYTITLIGYIADVYTGIAEVITNPLKVLLFGMYFPLMTSGPILAAGEDAAQFFLPHRISYRHLTHGVQRMLWGFFQKLVIAERLSVLVAAVYADPAAYPGAFVWLATVCFAFQLYTDFNGLMDIVLGLSETFGLVMPENFRIPFLAKNISEYWRRWHITLGAWMRTHFYYPLLRTRPVARMQGVMRERFGKKRGKQLSNFAVLFLLWFVIGLWHGGEMKYVIGSGLLHWAYIVFGELTLPLFVKLCDALHIKREGKAADAFRVIRTFFLVNIGFVFFRADSVPHALTLLRSAVGAFNPQVLFDGSILQLGLDAVDLGVVLYALILLIAVDVLRVQKGAAAEAQETPDTRTHVIRTEIDRCPLVIRWMIWFALLFAVILLGRYGPDFSASEFIYRGF